MAGRWSWTWMAACVAALAVGCAREQPAAGPEAEGGPGTGDTQGGGGPPAPPAGATRLRLVHASPDAPAVDVYARGDTTPLARDVTYQETTAWVQVPFGVATLELRPAGAAPDTAPVFTSEHLPVPQGASVTVVAAGLLNSIQPDRALRMLPLAEGFGPEAAAIARVRVVHASPDAPTVDLDVEDDGLPEVGRLGPFSDTGAEGLSLPAGRPLPLGVRADGGKLTAFLLPALPAGATLFAIAAGVVESRVDGQRGFGVLLVGPEGTVGFVRQDPFVHVLHAVPDAPPVDVFAGTTEVASGLAFGQLSARLQLPPGTRSLELFPAAAGTERPAGVPVAAEALDFGEPGETYLVTAAGLLAPDGALPGLRLLALQADFGPTRAEGETADTLARVRVVHAVPDAPAVDVGPVDAGAFTRAVLALEYLEASPSEGLALPAPAQVTLGLSLHGADPLATFQLGLTPGQRLFAVAAGRLEPTGGVDDFRLLAVDAPPTQTVGGTPWTVSPLLPAED